MPKRSRTLRTFAIMATALLVAACYGPIPTAKRTLPIATTVSNEHLFECVEQGISKFTAAGDYWQAITRNDAASGILESGHFQDSNITGFRLRIQRKPGQPQAQLHFKGSGAYHFDLGVDQAADAMVAALQACHPGDLRNAKSPIQDSANG